MPLIRDEIKVIAAVSPSSPNSTRKFAMHVVDLLRILAALGLAGHAIHVP
jgi:hypothetical protein